MQEDFLMNRSIMYLPYTFSIVSTGKNIQNHQYSMFFKGGAK